MGSTAPAGSGVPVKYGIQSWSVSKVPHSILTAAAGGAARVSNKGGHG